MNYTQKDFMFLEAICLLLMMHIRRRYNNFWHLENLSRASFFFLAPKVLLFNFL